MGHSKVHYYFCCIQCNQALTFGTLNENTTVNRKYKVIQEDKIKKW